MIADSINIDLIKELGLDQLPEEKQKEYAEKLTEVYEIRLNSALLDRLPEDKKVELDTLLDTEEDITPFLKENIPNVEMIASEILADLKVEILDLQNLVEETLSSTQ